MRFTGDIARRRADMNFPFVVVVVVVFFFGWFFLGDFSSCVAFFFFPSENTFNVDFQCFYAKSETKESTITACPRVAKLI